MAAIYTRTQKAEAGGLRVEDQVRLYKEIISKINWCSLHITVLLINERRQSMACFVMLTSLWKDLSFILISQSAMWREMEQINPIQWVKSYYEKEKKKQSIHFKIIFKIMPRCSVDSISGDMTTHFFFCTPQTLVTQKQLSANVQ